MRGSNCGYEDPFQENLDYWSGRLKSAKDSVEGRYALTWWKYYDRVSLEAFCAWGGREDLLGVSHKAAMDEIIKK